jgi:PhzF family phenazine biosynthesis protein
MEILRYTAFTRSPEGGNPAGVVLDADELSDERMLRIAADLGYSETAFLSRIRPDSARIRYFTPLAEIAFCGHATIASTAALATHAGATAVDLETNAGTVPVTFGDGLATLHAVDTTVGPLDPALLAELLEALRIDPEQLDSTLPPALIHGGNTHTLIAVSSPALDALDYDADALLALQRREGWDGAMPVVARIDALTFASRNPFPTGGIREDPATGSTAAGLGAYLRDGGHVDAPTTVTVRQGHHIGRPSEILVDIPAEGRIAVRGAAIEL